MVPTLVVAIAVVLFVVVHVSLSQLVGPEIKESARRADENAQQLLRRNVDSEKISPGHER